MNRQAGAALLQIASLVGPAAVKRVPAVDSERLGCDGLGGQIERQDGPVIEGLALRKDVDRVGHGRQPVRSRSPLGPEGERSGKETRLLRKVQGESRPSIIDRTAGLHPAHVERQAGQRRLGGIRDDEKGCEAGGPSVRKPGAADEGVTIREGLERFAVQP